MDEMQLAQAVATSVAQTMWPRDVASKDTMGMQLLECKPGYAKLSMAIKALHLNGHAICHGGFIFTLADTTFAYACNSHNKVTVASGCSIEFLRPGKEGDLLTCEGVEQTLSGRHGVYDMKVSNQRGEVVALFRGKSTQIAGEIVPSSKS